MFNLNRIVVLITTAFVGLATTTPIINSTLCPVGNLSTPVVWIMNNATQFAEPTTTNETAFFLSDTPAHLSTSKVECECPFTRHKYIDGTCNWMANGSWVYDPDHNKCELVCDRCVMYHCVASVLSFDSNGTASCIKPVAPRPSTTPLPTSELVTSTSATQAPLPTITNHTCCCT